MLKGYWKIHLWELLRNENPYEQIKEEEVLEIEPATSLGKDDCLSFPVLRRCGGYDEVTFLFYFSTYSVKTLPRNLQSSCLYLHTVDGKITRAVFLDISKAFDTINHQILLDKLCKYGIRGLPHAWFSSYITNRKQFVKVGNTESSSKTITCGVPQGSTLGPLLFLLYINDLPESSKKLIFRIFDHDTNIFYSSKDPEQLQRVNEELGNVSKYCTANKLSINFKKTHYMLITSPRKKVDVQVSACDIEQKSQIKYLGVFIDDCLKWDAQLQCINNKITKNIGILYKLRVRSFGVIRVRISDQNLSGSVWIMVHQRNLRIHSGHDLASLASDVHEHSTSLFQVGWKVTFPANSGVFVWQVWNMGYWPSVRGNEFYPSSFCCMFGYEDGIEVHKLAKKRTKPISRHSERAGLVNKWFIYGFGEFFLSGHSG